MIETSLLRKVPIFSKLRDEELVDLANKMVTRNLPAGKRLFAQDDPGDAMFIVLKGRVNIVKESQSGEELVLQSIGPLQLFGEVAMLDGGPRTAGAKTVEQTVLLSMDRQDFLDFLSTSPRSALSIMSVLAARLRNSTELLRSSVTRNLDSLVERSLGERLAERLVGLVASWPFLILVAPLAVVTLYLFTGREGWGTQAQALLIALALVLLPLIVLQSTLTVFALRYQARRERVRANLDYQLSLKLELEFIKLNQRLDNDPNARRESATGFLAGHLD